VLCYLVPFDLWTSYLSWILILVYNFNPHILIDLVSILIDERTSMYRVKKAEMMKILHEHVRSHIEEKTTKYAKHNNKGHKMVRFKLGDLV